MPSVTMSVTGAEIVPANASRKSIIIQNQDTTDSVFIKRESGEAKTVSSTVQDFKLQPGASISFNSLLDGVQAVQARYTGIASANTPRIAFFESEDIVR